jgi:hypothetical protein
VARRMGIEQAKEIYKQRACTAECVNAIARNRGLRQFTVRGLQIGEKRVAVVRACPQPDARSLPAFAAGHSATIGSASPKGKVAGRSASEPRSSLVMSWRRRPFGQMGKAATFRSWSKRKRAWGLPG